MLRWWSKVVQYFYCKWCAVNRSYPHSACFFYPTPPSLFSVFFFVTKSARWVPGCVGFLAGLWDLPAMNLTIWWLAATVEAPGYLRHLTTIMLCKAVTVNNNNIIIHSPWRHPVSFAAKSLWPEWRAELVRVTSWWWKGAYIAWTFFVWP